MSDRDKLFLSEIGKCFSLLELAEIFDITPIEACRIEAEGKK